MKDGSQFHVGFGLGWFLALALVYVVGSASLDTERKLTGPACKALRADSVILANPSTLALVNIVCAATEKAAK